ncbi:Mob1/phocein [Piedraia hortae CBS 480.64]|uniref:Mob1/phocein n=1 Tax=Piedraia hortae CBS 480.64 TaxID=1314780 RepID=A0A6A7C6C6_9PEZI|nr:Mob1/phocein [Piedraia hortae CBS 480.64]
MNDQAFHMNAARQGKIPMFFREEYAKFIVKGNFMTLAAQPQNVEKGEWLAHQLVEQTRLLSNMLGCVQAADRANGRPVCTEQTCPTMSAGIYIYPWMDPNSREYTTIPAPRYISYVQTWVGGIIQGPRFPTDSFVTAPNFTNSTDQSTDASDWLGKVSGFPREFESDIRNMYKQMFRCYAHLYWQHWLDFWNFGSHRELNTCFMHFINVGRLFNLISEKETQPMQPLIELWVRQGLLMKLPEASNPPQSQPQQSERQTATAANGSTTRSQSPSPSPAPQSQDTTASPAKGVIAQ